MSTPETALTVVARAALALGSDKARAELAELVKKSANITEVKNAAGREECHSAAMVLVRARTNIEKIGKAARDDATKFSKAVIAEEKALIGITQPEEDRLLGLRDGWDKARAAEKAEAERIERERVAAIHARIGAIKANATLALECRTSAKVEELLQAMTDKWVAYNFEDDFEEFGDEAQAAYDATAARMKEISCAKLAEEQERARIAAEQEAERQRLAAERAELERRREAARAEQAKADEERRKQAEADAAELARQRAALAEENARINAERERQQAAQAAEAARLAEQRAELERQHAETAAMLAAAKAIPEPLKQALADVVDALAPEPAIQMIEPAPSRPTDIQIVEALAERFGVAEPVALSWLVDFDVETALDVYETATA